MKFIRKHLEWFTFLSGLLLLGLMDPGTTGVSFCLFDLAGIDFCPGEGLGHSISYTFRGDFDQAMTAHFMGPSAVLILSGRILYIWMNMYQKQTNTNTTEY